MPNITAGVRWSDNTDALKRNLTEGLDSIARTVSQVKAELKDATATLKDLEKAAEDWKDSAGNIAVPQLAADIDKQKASVQALKDELGNLKQASKDSADGMKGVADGSKAAADGIKSASDQADKAQANLRQMATAFSTLGREMTVAITVPIVGAATAATAFAADFETEMTRVQTLAGASAQEVDVMGQAILALAPKVGIGPAELAKGLFVIESAGYKGADALNVLTTAAQMSALGMGKTDDITRALVGTMLSYTNQNLSAAQAGDILVKTVQLGNMKIDELVPALARVNPIAAAMGIKFQDVAAAMATFTHMGASSSVAATGLRAVLSNILTDSAKTEKGFQLLASTLSDSSISMQNFKKAIQSEGLAPALIDLMTKANNAGEAGTEALSKIFPNIRALTEVLAIAGPQAQNYTRILNGVNDAAGTLAEGTKATKATIAQQWNELTAQLQVLAIEVGQDLLPQLKSLIDDVLKPGATHVESWVKAFEALPGPIKVFAEIILGLGAAGGPVLLGLGAVARAIASIQLLLFGSNIANATSVVGILSKLGKLGAIGEAVGGMGSFELMAALGTGAAVAGSVVAAAPAGYLAYKSTSGVKFNGNPNVGGLVTPPMATDINLPRGDISLEPRPGFVPGGVVDLTSRTTQTKSLKDAIVALTAEQKSAIQADKQAGLNIKEIAADLAQSHPEWQLSAELIGAYERSLRGAGAGASAMAKAWQEYTSGIEPAKTSTQILAQVTDQLGSDVVEGIKYDLQRGQSQAVLAKVYQVSAQNIRDIAEAMKLADKEASAWAKTQDQVAKVEFGGKPLEQITPELEKLGTKVPESTFKQMVDGADQAWKAQQTLADEIAKSTLTTYDYQKQKIWEWVAQQQVAFKGSAGQWDTYNADILAQADIKFQELETAHGQAIAHMTGQVQTWADTWQSTLGAIPGLLQQSFTGGGGLSGGGEAILSHLGSGAIGKLFSGQGGLGSELSKGIMSLGLNSFTVGLAEMIPAIGQALGALVGPLISWIKGLFDHVPSDLQGVAHGYGVQLSDQVLKGIRDTMSSMHLTEQAATIFNADKLFPTVDSSNFVQATKITHDLFSMIQTGQLTVSQGAQTLEAMWPKLAVAGTDAYGRIDASLKELITLNGVFGTQSQAIAQFLSTQAGNAVDGFNAVAASSKDAVTGYDAIKKAVDDATTAVASFVDANGHIADQAGYDAALQQQAQALDAQKSSASGAKQELSDLGIQAVASISAAVASGLSLSQALDKAGPGIDALIQSYKDLGISTDNAALQALMYQRQVQQAAPQLVAGVAGLSQEMIALDNLGILNTDTFGSMERTGVQMYTRLQAQVATVGGTTKDALLPMQDYLHQAAIEAQQLGVPLDDNTQMLVNQSKELGIWKDTGKTATDKLTDAIDNLTKAILGIPDAAQQATDGLSNTLGKYKPPTLHVPYQFDPTNTLGGTAQPGPNDVQPTGPVAVATGGLVTALGIQRFSAGGRVQELGRHYFNVGGKVGPMPTAYAPLGTDVSPAMRAPEQTILTNAHRSVGMATGGLVTALGIQRFSAGGTVREMAVQHFDVGGRVGTMPVAYAPIGTDTVPAMLTPGELVINALQQDQLGRLLSAGAAISSNLVKAPTVAAAPVAAQTPGDITLDELHVTVNLNSTKVTEQIIKDVQFNKASAYTKLRAALGVSS